MPNTHHDQTTLEIQKVNAAIERWQSRLRRAVNAIKKLDGRRKRLVAKAAAKPAQPAGDDLDIPGFLRRNPADDAAKAAILADNTDRAKRKAAGAKARRKAQRSGETKRMPLTGKAAVAAIRGQ